MALPRINRRLIRRFGTLSLVALFTLAGCATSGTAPSGVAALAAGDQLLPATSRRKTPDNSTRYWWVTVWNNTHNFIWVTRYWNEDELEIFPWQIEGADCVASGQQLTRAISYRFTETRLAKLRVEVKDYGATSCSANTISDFYGRVCDLNFWSGNPTYDWIRGFAEIHVVPPHFQIHTDCDIARGYGPYPGPF
ncbi:MAG TPA: hypothetical protein VFL13_01520 [Candidatus Baltobacteraceae bacterium]|nr:hypothetical protein [Candidatus Baltobacteraceae bacterium]